MKTFMKLLTATLLFLISSAVMAAPYSMIVKKTSVVGTPAERFIPDDTLDILGTFQIDNLKFDGNGIVSTDTDGNIALTPNGDGILVLDGMNFPISGGIDGQVLYQSGAGQLAWKTISAGALSDADADTLIQVEKGADDDTIRLDAGGTEVATFTGTTADFQIPMDITHTGDIVNKTILSLVGKRTTGNGVDGDAVYMDWIIENDAGTNTPLAQIGVEGTSLADGAENAKVEISHTVAGAPSVAITLTDDGEIDLQNNVNVTGAQFYQTPEATITPTGTTATLNWNLGNNKSLDLGSATGDVTLTLSNAQAGAMYQIVVTQGATERQFVWPANVYWENGVEEVLSSADDETDVVHLYYDGVNYAASTIKNIGTGNPDIYTDTTTHNTQAIANNQAATAFCGITIDVADSYAGKVEVELYRKDDTPDRRSASFVLSLQHDGTNWQVQTGFQNILGTPDGLVFSITTAAGVGTLKYDTTSTLGNMLGANYAGKAACSFKKYDL